jgi:hypothetical protein
MSKLRPLKAHTADSIAVEIESAVHHALLVRSSLAHLFKKDDKIRSKWDSMVEQMLKLQSSIPDQLRKTPK